MQAAGIENKRWKPEEVVAMTEDTGCQETRRRRPTRLSQKRLAEDAMFSKALAAM